MQKTNFNPQKIILALFNFLLLFTPLYFRFVNEELFEFNKMILVYALTVLITFFWSIKIIKEQKFALKKTPLDIPIILFVLSQLVSTIFSIHPRTSFLGYYSRFNGGLLSTISYIFLYYAFINNIKKKNFTSLLISTFISGILVSTYGILEHFGHSISCILAPGAKNFSVSCWKPDVQSRVFATFGQPNWLAAYTITILPLSIIMTIKKKLKLSQKLFFMVSSILLFMVLIFTKSRSGLLGFIIGIIILIFGILTVFFKNKKNTKTQIDLKFLTILTTILILITSIYGTIFTPSLKNFISTRIQADINNKAKTQKITQPVTNRLETGGTDSGEIRKIVWKGGLNVWKRYPIIGSGVETFAYSYYLDRPREHNDVSEWDFLYNKAHNELINLLATTGIFGLGTYLLIFVVFSKVLIKIVFSPKKSTEIKLISISIAAGISSLFVSNFFGFSTVMVNVLMFILFATLIILSQENIKNDAQQKIYKINSINQYISIFVISIFTLVLLTKIYNYWTADKLFSQGKTYIASGDFLTGIQKELKAIKKSPKEALYYDNLSDNYATLAVELAKDGQATNSASVANEAIKFSDLAIQYNNQNLNFYRTRARMFVVLAQLNDKFLIDAQNTLNKAIKLAPTDPKFVYTQAVIELSKGNKNEAKQLLKEALTLKPNYIKARWKLSSIYENDKEIDKAVGQLRYMLDNVVPGDQNIENKILQLKML